MTKIFAIYKPSGPTSFDIIHQLRKITGVKKIGHAGTLDPLAEGVLVVAITREGTKQLTNLIQKNKTYQVILELGATSDTHDSQGKLVPHPVDRIPSLAKIQLCLRNFVGEINQTPPKFSAIKIQGKPAYKLARSGQEFKLESRKVIIYQIKIQDYQYPLLKLLIKTGPGVYIRSLARDVGEQLNTGSYVKHLKRLRVGNFESRDALTVEEFEKQWPAISAKIIG